MDVLLTSEEVEARLAEIEPSGEEYDSLRFLQQLYYQCAEGLIVIEDGRCYATGA